MALIAVVVALLAVVSGSGGGGGGTTNGQSTDTTAAQTSTTTTKTGSAKAKKKPAKPARKNYTIQAGDTLGGIAAKTGVPLSRIQELNPSVDPHALTTGQEIRLK